MIFDLVKVFGLVSLVVGAYFIFKYLKFNPSISVNFEKTSIGLFCIIISAFCFYCTTKPHLEKVKDELYSEVIETLTKKINVEEELYNEFAEKDEEYYEGAITYYDTLYTLQINKLLENIKFIEDYLTRDNK